MTFGTHCEAIHPGMNTGKNEREWGRDCLSESETQTQESVLVRARHRQDSQHNGRECHAFIGNGCLPRSTEKEKESESENTKKQHDSQHNGRMMQQWWWVTSAGYNYTRWFVDLLCRVCVDILSCSVGQRSRAAEGYILRVIAHYEHEGEPAEKRERKNRERHRKYTKNS